MTDKDGFELLSSSYSAAVDEIRITVHRSSISFTQKAWKAMKEPKFISVWLNPINKNLKIKYEPETTLNVHRVTMHTSGTKRITASAIVRHLFETIGVKDTMQTFRCVGKKGPENSIIFDLKQAKIKTKKGG